MTKTAIVGAMALVGMTAFADSAFWTGAQDNFWTNAANWVQANGSPAVAAPGIVSNGVDDVWSATMTYDTAVFDRASARMTIDLDGLHVMRNITVTGADTPTYTFGTSSAQTLRIVSEAQSNSYNNGGRITVEASVVHAPVFAATLSALASGTINEGFHVVNNSAQTITLGDIGRYIDAKPIGVYPANIYDKDGNLPSWATTYAAGNVFVQLDGSGPFVLAGNFVGLPSNRYGAFCLKNANGQATVPENHVLSNVRALSVVAKTTLNLEAGSKFVFTYGGDFTVSGGSGFTTTGEGEFALYEDSDARQNSAVYIYNNCPWINQARLTVTNAAGNAAGAKFWYSGTGSLNQHGTITFEGPNTIPGNLAMANVNYSGPYYKTSTVGADASGGTLGYGREIELSNLGALVYTGPGETSSRTFRILTGKDTLGGNAMMLEQSGDGTLGR